MALKAMVKTLDGIEDAQKSLYRRESNGAESRYVLDVEPVEGYALENVAGLKGALVKERENVAEAGKRLDAFRDLDPVKARDALAKVDAMKSWTPDDKVREQIEARTREMAVKHDHEVASLKTSNAQLRAGYEKVTVEHALVQAATRHQFMVPAIAARLFRDQVALDANLQPVVLGADGKARQTVNNDGAVRSVTIDEFVAEQAKNPDYAPLIQGNGATGTRGAGGNHISQQAAPQREIIREEVAMGRLADLIVRQRA